MVQRCLLIADDLTGGADAGAQFAKRGLNTLLIFCKDHTKIDFSQYAHRDVLVVNTDSRGLTPEKASSLISNLLKTYHPKVFPIIYKKIDSTLRGNLGYEIDTILKEMNGALGFMAPSYPEQNRRLVGGIMIIGEKPLALTEVAQNTTSPIQESHVDKLLQQQSRNRVGWIDITLVASGVERLKEMVEREQNKGTKIIIFDAGSRQDLTNVAEVGFSLESKPLFIGSAGLAEEVAKKISSSQLHPRSLKSYKHVLIVCGTASSVTHQQLRRLEFRKIPVFQLNPSLFIGDFSEGESERKDISRRIGNCLSRGITILKTIPEMLHSEHSNDLPISLKISKTLAEITLSALAQSRVEVHDLALLLTGGDTAQGVINRLDISGIEIEGELLEGIVQTHLTGGKWDGLLLITKAGAFGKEDALEKIITILEKGTPLDKEEG
jgi:uncharacterized protein YgbK (DUF1537 family)